MLKMNGTQFDDIRLTGVDFLTVEGNLQGMLRLQSLAFYRTLI
jgi:hypothetical protein